MSTTATTPLRKRNRPLGLYWVDVPLYPGKVYLAFGAEHLQFTFSQISPEPATLQFNDIGATYMVPSGPNTNVIAMGTNPPSQVQYLGLLAHEVTHAVQNTLLAAGENPGASEAPAYLTQHLMMWATTLSMRQPWWRGTPAFFKAS